MIYLPFYSLRVIKLKIYSIVGINQDALYTNCIIEFILLLRVCMYAYMHVINKF